MASSAAVKSLLLAERRWTRPSTLKPMARYPSSRLVEPLRALRQPRGLLQEHWLDEARGNGRHERISH